MESRCLAIATRSKNGARSCRRRDCLGDVVHVFRLLCALPRNLRLATSGSEARLAAAPNRLVFPTEFKPSGLAAGPSEGFAGTG